MLEITIGKRIRTFGGWYEHHTVSIDGKQLDGFIQVKRANKRTTITTHYQSTAVLGHDWGWLARCNQIAAA